MESSFDPNLTGVGCITPTITTTMPSTLVSENKITFERVRALPGIDSTTSTAYAYRPQDNYARDENDTTTGWTRVKHYRRRKNKYRQYDSTPANPLVRNISELVSNFGSQRKAEYNNKYKFIVEDMLINKSSANNYLMEAIETGRWSYVNKTLRDH
jgi:hypothetical protein